MRRPHAPTADGSRRSSDHRPRAIEANWSTLAGTHRAGRMRRRGQRRRLWLRAEPVTPRFSMAGCRTFFVADVGEGARARALAPDADIYILNGLMPRTAQAVAERLCAAGHQQPDRACRMGRVRRHQQLARRRRAARRYRHEPARPHARRAAAIAPAPSIRKPRLHAADEPSRLRRHARPSDERPADPCCFANPHALSAASRPRSPIRPASSSAARVLLRSGAPRLRALWRQPDARAATIRCGRSSSSRAASSRCARRHGRARRLLRDLTARAPSRIAIVAVGYADGFRARPAPPRASRRRGDRGRQALSHRRPRVHGPHRRRRDRPARGQRASRRSCHADRRRHERRRARRCQGTIGYEVLTRLGRRYHRVYEGA